MSLASSLESLRKIDINDLDLNNIGSWPAAVKVIVCVLLTAAVLALGYNFHLSDMQAQLDSRPRKRRRSSSSSPPRPSRPRTWKPTRHR